MSKEEEIQILRDLIEQLDNALIPEVKKGMKAMRDKAKLEGEFKAYQHCDYLLHSEDYDVAHEIIMDKVKELNRESGGEDGKT